MLDVVPWQNLPETEWFLSISIHRQTCVSLSPADTAAASGPLPATRRRYRPATGAPANMIAPEQRPLRARIGLEHFAHHRLRPDRVDHRHVRSCSSRRKEALTSGPPTRGEPPHVGCHTTGCYFGSIRGLARK